jgi:hypothetical protein
MTDGIKQGQATTNAGVFASLRMTNGKGIGSETKKGPAG